MPGLTCGNLEISSLGMESTQEGLNFLAPNAANNSLICLGIMRFQGLMAYRNLLEYVTSC